MNLETTIAISFDHWRKRFSPNSTTEKMILMEFAIVELRLGEADAPTDPVRLFKRAGDDGFERFFLWYYINYVVDYVPSDL